MFVLIYSLRRRRKFSGGPLKGVLLFGWFDSLGFFFGREKSINASGAIEMSLALHILLTIDHFDFVFILSDECIFVPEQGVQLFLVVLCCGFLVLQLVFVHLLVLFGFFALLMQFIVKFSLELT